MWNMLGKLENTDLIPDDGYKATDHPVCELMYRSVIWWIWTETKNDG